MEKVPTRTMGKWLTDFQVQGGGKIDGEGGIVCNFTVDINNVWAAEHMTVLAGWLPHCRPVR